MNYPNAYRLEFTGKQLKDILEDVCDNLFNKDPFYQQGGDMVRVGGMSYTCAPKEDIGNRISEMTLARTGEPVEADKQYVVAGWASVNEGTEGPPIYELMENYFTRKKVITAPAEGSVKITGY